MQNRKCLIQYQLPVSQTCCPEVPLHFTEQRLACTPEGEHLGMRLPSLRVVSLTNHLSCTIASIDKLYLNCVPLSIKS